MRFGKQTITRIREGVSATEDDYGNPVPGADSELDIPGCSVQPGGGSEVDDRREATTTLYTVWCKELDAVLESDRVRFSGTVYAVDGAIERWRDMPIQYDVIRLKAVAG